MRGCGDASVALRACGRNGGFVFRGRCRQRVAAFRQGLCLSYLCECISP